MPLANFRINNGASVDSIVELTAAAGVTVEGVKIEDSDISSTALVLRRGDADTNVLDFSVDNVIDLNADTTLNLKAGGNDEIVVTAGSIACRTASILTVDTINEAGGAAGCTIEGVNIDESVCTSTALVLGRDATNILDFSVDNVVDLNADVTLNLKAAGADEIVVSANLVALDTATVLNVDTINDTAGGGGGVTLEGVLVNASVVNSTGLQIGRDTDNELDFATTDNQIDFRVNAASRFLMESDGTLSAQTASYEALVTADQDITNKKYVDDTISAQALTKTTATGVTTATVIDSVLVDNIEAVKWIIAVTNEEAAQLTEKHCEEIMATHDGEAASDATTVDYNSYGVVETGTIDGLSIVVELNGATTSQVMRLSVTSTDSVSVVAQRITFEP